MSGNPDKLESELSKAETGRWYPQVAGCLEDLRRYTPKRKGSEREKSATLEAAAGFLSLGQRARVGACLVSLCDAVKVATFFIVMAKVSSELRQA